MKLTELTEPAGNSVSAEQDAKDLDAYRVAELVKGYLTSMHHVRELSQEDRDTLRAIAERRRDDDCAFWEEMEAKRPVCDCHSPDCSIHNRFQSFRVSPKTIAASDNDFSDPFDE